MESNAAGGACGEGSSGPSGEGNNQCSCSCTNMGSTVNLSSGNYFFTETDLVLPAVGIPVSFNRRYNSNQYASGALGHGWVHNYELRLSENPDQSVDYINEEGLKFTFKWDGTSYIRPQGRYWYLEKTLTGWTMNLKGGMQYAFDTQGKLMAQQDLNGNRVEITYTDDLPNQVIDATGRIALTFAYNTNRRLESITDAANRKVSFGQDMAGNLISITDVLNNTKLYTYDSSHRLLSITDYNGNQHTYAYDHKGRCYRHEDPTGGVKSISYDFKHKRAVVTDELGNDSLHVYNDNGNPIEVIDPLGNRTQMSWDADFNKLSSTDARGLTTTFGYDERGNLNNRSAPGQGTTNYTHDPIYDRVLTITDAELNTTTNTYDAQGNLVSSEDAEGNITGYTYKPDGLPESITRPGAAVTQLGYDTAGNLTTLTDAENNETVLGYNTAGHITSITDPLTHQRTLEVDAKGRVEAIIDPDNKRTEFGYDNEGNRTSMTDPEGKVTQFAYDAMNRLTQVTDPNGNITRTEYDLVGNVTARVDAKGNRTQYKYDQGGRLEEITTPDGGVTSLGYCADVSASCSTCGSGADAGSTTKACAVIDPEGNLTVIDYDEAGRLTKVTDPLGSETITAYDSLGRKTAVTDAEGKTTQYRYTPAGKLWQVEDALGYITEYGYDDRGNRISVKDANGHITQFEYDKMDRLTKEINPLGKETIFTYDAAGNRDTKLDPNGNLIQYVYDHNRRLTDIIYPDMTLTHFDYDDKGNKIYEENQYSQRSYDHDDLGRVTTVTDHILNKVIGYEYDQNGNRSKMIGPDGEETVYRYDALNRIKELVEPDGGSTLFGYDKLGRRDSISFANGIKGHYFYNPAGRLESIVYKNTAGDVLQSFTYTHDKVGNRTSKTFASGQSESYGYDELHRLTAATYPNGRSVDYQYDPVGNREFVTESWDGGGSETTSYTYSDFNQVLTTTDSNGITTYAWDDNGNLVGKHKPNGEITQYDYNFENRLVSILYPNATTNGFGYDPQGIRVFKEDSQGRHNFLIDQVSVLAEYNGVGAKAAWYNHNPQRIDEIISQVQSASKLYHLVDGLGSVTGLVNQAQVKVAAYSYDAYGAVTDQQVQPGLSNSYLFTGREFDSMSKLVYSRSRYLDPAVGSWLRKDSAGYIDGPNLFSYVANNPISFFDPMGKWCNRSGYLKYFVTPNAISESWPAIPHPFAPGFCLYWGSTLRNCYLDLTMHREDYAQAGSGRWGPHLNYKKHRWSTNIHFPGYEKRAYSNYHFGLFFRDDGQTCIRHGYKDKTHGDTLVDLICISNLFLYVLAVMVAAGIISFLMPAAAFTGTAVAGIIMGLVLASLFSPEFYKERRKLCPAGRTA